MTRLLFFLLAIFIFKISDVSARDLTISVARIPKMSPNRNEGIFINILKAMQKAYPEGKISYDVRPFKRSLLKVINNEVDLHLPVADIKAPSLPFQLSKISVGNVEFDLYTHIKNKKINVNNFRDFKIEVDAGNQMYFSFKNSIISSCIECSLKKVNAGRIDGYLHGAPDSDLVIAKYSLTHIKKQFYDKYDIRFAISKKKSKKDFDEINHILNMIIKRMKSNGDYDKTIKFLIH